jgi:exosortase/archaeosortase family protein
MKTGPYLRLALGLAIAGAVELLGFLLSGELLTGTARVFGALLEALGTPARVDGTRVSAGARAFVVVAECTAITPIALLWGALAAHPGPRWRRLGGALGGALALQGLNQARLLGLWEVAERWPQRFDFAHLYVGQGLMMLAVLLLFVASAAGPGRGPINLRSRAVQS